MNKLKVYAVLLLLGGAGGGYGMYKHDEESLTKATSDVARLQKENEALRAEVNAEKNLTLSIRQEFVDTQAEMAKLAERMRAFMERGRIIPPAVVAPPVTPAVPVTPVVEVEKKALPAETKPELKVEPRPDETKSTGESPQKKEALK